MGTIMANPRPRSKKQHGRPRPKGPSRLTDQQRARHESPRPLLVLAVILTPIAFFSDWITEDFLFARHPRGSHVHLDIAVPFLAIGGSVLAAMAWRSWWKLQSSQNPNRHTSQKSDSTKERG